MELKEALKQIRNTEKRKFSQGIDLIVNLKDIDLKRDNIATIVTLPHKVKDKKVCGFFEKRNELVDTVTKLDFPKYKDKKELKKLVKGYDFFIGSAPLMPSVATTFGKVLGPAGKMPSPQLGIIGSESNDAIKGILDKIAKAAKIRVKEASVKLLIGTENMSDEHIIDNIKTVYAGLVDVLPTKKENVRNVMIKLTMGKPIKVEVK